MFQRSNMFSSLSYESDDEEYERRLMLEKQQKDDHLVIKKSQARERRLIREIEILKQKDIDYTNSMKRRKVIQSYNGIPYVSKIEEDTYNIARYLGLDNYLQYAVFTSSIFFGLFAKEEYLNLVKIMELNKNIKYLLCFPDSFIEDIRYVQLKIEMCVINGLSTDTRLIYEIFLIYLQDTICVRTAFENQSRFGHMMGIIREGLKNKIKNPYRSISEFENEYYIKYFEVGKRYLAKRNNSKVLIAKYLRFVGKLMVLYRKIK
jgi:hypothetical protein